jgi:hypothetical protein
MFRLFWLVKNAGYPKLLKLNYTSFSTTGKRNISKSSVFCFYTRLNLLLVLLESSFASKEKINQKHFKKYFEIFLLKKFLFFIFFNWSNNFFALLFLTRKVNRDKFPSPPRLTYIAQSFPFESISLLRILELNWKRKKQKHFREKSFLLSKACPLQLE